MSTRARRRASKTVPGQAANRRGDGRAGTRRGPPQVPTSSGPAHTSDARRLVWVAAVVAVALAGLLGIYLASGDSHPEPGAGAYRFQVGQPGPGQPAPDIELAATNGTTFDLAALRDENVLLYFQEGLGCQPCWDQITAIEQDPEAFRDLGVDRIVSVTTDPLDALRQKVDDQGITTPVLSDPDLRVSRAYRANSYGMMGDTRNGHSFVLVGPHGTIAWRADYGGEPDYTMYVPPENLLADLRAGIAGKAPSGS